MRLQPVRLGVGVSRLRRRAITPRILLSDASNDHKQALCASSTIRFKSSTTPFYGTPRPAPSTSLNRMSVVDRMTLAVQSAVTALADPTRADAVATLGEVTGSIALRELQQKMLQHPTGQLILQEKPTVDNSLLEREDCRISSTSTLVGDDTTSALTFGQAYASFMQHHGFHPEARDAVQYIDDPELAYVMLRYRQTHDFSHVLCDLPPTVLGELALKWLELLQTGLPVAALSVTAGTLQLSSRERQILSEVYLPWAVEMSQQSECLLNVYFEQEFATNLDDLRRKIGIVPVPSVDEFTMKTSIDR